MNNPNKCLVCRNDIDISFFFIVFYVNMIYII